MKHQTIMQTAMGAVGSPYLTGQSFSEDITTWPNAKPLKIVGVLFTFVSCAEDMSGVNRYPLSANGYLSGNDPSNSGLSGNDLYRRNTTVPVSNATMIIPFNEFIPLEWHLSSSDWLTASVNMLMSGCAAGDLLEATFAVTVYYEDEPEPAKSDYFTLRTKNRR